jgi:nucleotide-binding universal stress UspA family protein
MMSRFTDAACLEVAMNPKPVVLCPIDFSEACCGALRYAAAVAEHFQSELLIATVNDPLLADADAMTAEEGHLAHETLREMERFYRDTFADRPVPIPHPRFESLVGNPALEILSLSVRSHADLIVMSSRGDSGVRKMFFGSTAERVLRETTVPVLVTPPDGIGPAHLGEIPQLVHRMLVPLDLSAASDRQARVAKAIAEALAVPILLLHVVEPFRSNRPGLRAMPRIAGERRSRAEEMLASLVERLSPWRRVESLVALGEPSEEIAKIAHDRGAGLIVMGLHSTPVRGGPRMGSVTYRVLCLARVPVFALPPLATAGDTAERREVGTAVGRTVA